MGDENQVDKSGEQGGESLDSALKNALTRGLQDKAGGDTGARARVMDGEVKSKSVLTQSVGSLTGRVKRRQMFAFCEELALLLECGMPLVKALSTLANRIDNTKLARIIMAMGSKVETGTTFTDAAAEFPRCFPPLVVSMFHAGERSGNLMQSLRHVADHGERLLTARHRAIGSLVYPVLVIILAFCVVSFAFSFSATAFKPILEDLGTEVPWSMSILLSLGMLWRSAGFWIVLVGGITALVVLYIFASRVSGFRLLRDRFLARCPFVRRFVKTSLAANFARIVSTMLDAGVPLQETLQITHDATRNELMRHTIRRVQQAVSEGGRMTPALEQARLFPPVAYDLASIGEEAGALERVFGRMAEIYEEKLAADTEILGKLVQPFILIILGAVVGFIVTGLFSMYSAVLTQIRTG